jgi:hypothetical protein
MCSIQGPDEGLTRIHPNGGETITPLGNSAGVAWASSIDTAGKNPREEDRCQEWNGRL